MRIVDLTLELSDGMQTHPAHARCVVIEFASHGATASRFRPPCVGFASRILMFSDHIGTHADSPFHFIPTGGMIEMEHVAHLETLPAPRFQFVGAPLRIRVATGSPIRAMAIFEQEGVHA